MSGLSPMWVRKVTPIDDGFVPYVAPQTYQYKPDLVQPYPQPQHSYATPRTTRGVNLGISNVAKTKVATSRFKRSVGESASLPMGPDVPFTDYLSKPGNKTSVNSKWAAAKNRTKPMGPDIKINQPKYISPEKTSTRQPIGPDVRHKPAKFEAAEEKLNVSASQPMGPDIPHRTSFRKAAANLKTKQRVIRAFKSTKKKDKAKFNDTVQFKENVVPIPMVANAEQENDDWKKPYMRAGEAAVLSWIRMYENRRNGNRFPRHAYNRYEIQYNPQGALESIKRTYGFHGYDF